MTLIEALHLLTAALAGCVLGAVFFGSLWWAVRRVPGSAHPLAWMLGSLVVRMCATLIGFYYVSGGSWQRLLACLLGFVAGRLVVTRLTRTPGEKNSKTSAEVSRASHAR